MISLSKSNFIRFKNVRWDQNIWECRHEMMKMLHTEHFMKLCVFVLSEHAASKHVKNPTTVAQNKDGQNYLHPF